MSALRDRYKLPPVMSAFGGKADIDALRLHSAVSLADNFVVLGDCPLIGYGDQLPQ